MPPALQARIRLEQVQPTALHAALVPTCLDLGLPAVHRATWVRTPLALEHWPVPPALQVPMQLERVQPTAATAARAPMRLGRGLSAVRGAVWERTTLALAP